MYKISRMILAVLAMATLSLLFLGADTYNSTITVYESDYGFQATGVVEFVTADATDSHFTKALYIGDTNYFNCFLWAYTDAVSNDDINVFVEYSMDRETWVLGTIASGKIFDDLNGGTVQADTINVTVGVADPLFHGMRWIRFEFDGQSGNPNLATVTWGAQFTKTYKMPRLSTSNRIKVKI